MLSKHKPSIVCVVMLELCEIAVLDMLATPPLQRGKTRYCTAYYITDDIMKMCMKCFEITSELAIPMGMTKYRMIEKK